MSSDYSLRPATAADAPAIARFFRMSSDGVADYIWRGLAGHPEYAGMTPLEIGAQRYARQNTAFSFENCTITERHGGAVGMLHAFPMRPGPDAGEPEEADPVLAPYAELELAPSLYVSGVAIDPDHRGRGLGTRLLAAAERQAGDLGLPAVSLVVFEQNTGAAALYARLGYREIKRRAIVPHPLIHHTGDAVLLALNVN